MAKEVADTPWFLKKDDNNKDDLKLVKLSALPTIAQFSFSLTHNSVLN